MGARCCSAGFPSILALQSAVSMEMVASFVSGDRCAGRACCVYFFCSFTLRGPSPKNIFVFERLGFGVTFLLRLKRVVFWDGKGRLSWLFTKNHGKKDLWISGYMIMGPSAAGAQTDEKCLWNRVGYGRIYVDFKS